MYRTDKQFMKNPATNASRVYVGNLPKTIVADDLETKFKVHGKILGLILHNGFAFIQYENENEAKRAIEMEHQTNLHGQKINVKQAAERRQGPMNQQGPRPYMNNQQMQQKPPMVNKPVIGPVAPPPTNQPTHGQQPPMEAPKAPEKQEQPEKPVQPSPQIQQQQQQMQAKPPPNQQQQQYPQKMDTGNNNNNRGGNNMDIRDNWDNPDHREDNWDRGRQGWDNRGNRKMRGGRGGGRGGFQNKQQFRDEPPFHGGPGGGPPMDDFNMKKMPPGPFQQQPQQTHPTGFQQPIDRIEEKNDCEIIVVSKALTEYAEYVEDRLKQLNLIVDLLFPNEDVPIGKVLANISSRGCLYAILVMPQNEEHRSLTLNILHGVPQEHRNMPIEDALILISRNFEAYMRGENLPTEKPGEMKLADKHPVAMQMALNMLAENRQLTTSQYDKLIKYLQDRRDLQYQFEVSEGIEQESQESNSKQAELQSRIMNILNKSTTDSAIPLSITAENPQPASTPLLKDPTVQKALDSFLGDMFKNMTD